MCVCVCVVAGGGSWQSPLCFPLCPLCRSQSLSYHSTYSLKLMAMLHLSALPPILCSQKSEFCSSLTSSSGEDEELLSLLQAPLLGRAAHACVVLHVSVGVASGHQALKSPGVLAWGCLCVCVCVCVCVFVCV